ncbi:prephenate dehydratase [Propionibacterium freudenreichii]|uniref:Prephenate dehydratase n=2 Tax=Propionibacterium freudenreichii TaxID=1744 RepID=D7GHS9_PROFC|nr:prephenate dehydratase [Propionibacterium freudenreichii]AJQ89877.1 Prephenate dehydratase [Propionibacterium freudenreichii subsp. freudenreichii]MCQ1998789.1 prephenate dehydratase [Propionibacterium freudenreichii]MCT2996396.1 prephenate dehydratase [Propionibacterium freudenreichii]MCT3000206.1 prephenate dehydratase [Propionibacterium freudenreichii]MCT3005923.1 prephenate dehydratase [Propionibacterium freudenreichii]
MLGYFGPEGTFTHQALLSVSEDEATPFSTVAAALDAVRAEEIDAAMVPIENSVEGSVSATIDNLGSLDAPRLQIMQEVLVEVTFDLCARPGTTLDQVHRIITHPHAAAQVRDWLSLHLPEAEVIERGSTAAAAQAVSDPDSGFDAAVCAPIAGRLYGLVPLATDIADNDAAVTRFVLVGRPGRPALATGADKTTLVAYMRHDEPGALLSILQQFAVRGVNLCRIESRPTKTTLGNYCFNMDAEGHLDDFRVAAALMGLKRVCKDVIFLGSYARADQQLPNVPVGAKDSDYRAAGAWLEGLGGNMIINAPGSTSASNSDPDPTRSPSNS